MKENNKVNNDQIVIINVVTASSKNGEINMEVEVENFGDVKYIQYKEIIFTEKPSKDWSTDYYWMILNNKNKEFYDTTDEQETEVGDILSYIIENAPELKDMFIHSPDGWGWSYKYDLT